MNRILTTLIFTFVCFLNVNASTNENKLYVVYSEYCSYSKDLIDNTLADKKIQEAINENFDYQLIEANTEKGKQLIEQFNIEGFPTQVLESSDNTVLAFGVLNIKEQLNYLNILQDLSAWEKYVFRETSLGYDEKNKKLLIPTLDDSYRLCHKETNPEMYVCAGKGGANHNFIIKGEKDGDFKVSIFHPLEKARYSQISISTFVKDGKVTQQSRCIYFDQWNQEKSKEKSGYEISRMECYVASAKICNLFDTIKTEEDFKSEEKFQEFISVLKSPEYKEQLLEAQKFNFRNAFLKGNRDKNFDYHSKLKIGFYDENLQGKQEKMRLLNFEESEAVKNSKNFSELVGAKKQLMLRFFIKPCARLSENNLIEKTNK